MLISRRKSLAALAAGPSLLLGSKCALAGAQAEEPLIDAVRTALSSAVAQQAPPVPEFVNTDGRLAYLRWLAA